MDEDSFPDELQHLHERQRLPNEYALVSGVSMHLQNPTSFQIPPEVIKRHVSVDHYVELRIDSSRFSMHEQDAVQCCCPSCNGEMKKPVLRHVHPASLVDIPPQQIPPADGARTSGFASSRALVTGSTVKLAIDSWSHDSTD